MGKKRYRRFSAEEKRRILKKTNGHCAYCGKLITYKTMSVDHVTPRCRYSKAEYADRLSNLLPACRKCNQYKHTRTLEEYRQYMRQAHLRLRTYYVTQILERYGIVELHPWNGLFWFESHADSKNDSDNDSENGSQNVYCNQSQRVAAGGN